MISLSDFPPLSGVFTTFLHLNFHAKNAFVKCSFSAKNTQKKFFYRGFGSNFILVFLLVKCSLLIWAKNTFDVKVAQWGLFIMKKDEICETFGNLSFLLCQATWKDENYKMPLLEIYTHLWFCGKSRDRLTIFAQMDAEQPKFCSFVPEFGCQSQPHCRWNFSYFLQLQIQEMYWLIWHADNICFEVLNWRISDDKWHMTRFTIFMTTQNTTQKNRFSEFQSCSEFSLNFHAQKSRLKGLIIHHV